MTRGEISEDLPVTDLNFGVLNCKYLVEPDSNCQRTPLHPHLEPVRSDLILGLKQVVMVDFRRKPINVCATYIPKFQIANGEGGETDCQTMNLTPIVGEKDDHHIAQSNTTMSLMD